MWGGGWVGAETGRPRLITFDIGGTSADIGIINDGQIVETDARWEDKVVQYTSELEGAGL